VATAGFSRVLALTDELGTYEHAEFTTIRAEHGYCVDDVARVLVVCSREVAPSEEVRRLGRGALEFLRGSQDAGGGCHNRRNTLGEWTSAVEIDDAWGRSLWGAGTAVARGDRDLVEEALLVFSRGAQVRSVHSRALYFGALGGAEVLGADPGNKSARALLTDVAGRLDEVGCGVGWEWPEARLTYANAVLPETMLAVGGALGRDDLTRRGLQLLRWLVERETSSGHLSVAPGHGSGPGDVARGFDQQPIEVAALADACARAATTSGELLWERGVVMAKDWFEGGNDCGVLMYDQETGGAYDGLGDGWVNKNQGAESSLAMVMVNQHAQVRAEVLV
jgi:hypothetical protein